MRNKKIFIIIALITVLSGMLMPAFVPAQAQEVDGPCSGDVDLGACVISIYRYALGVAVLLALVMIIFSGYLYMTAGGNAENVSKAKEIFAGAFIGLIILFGAVLILRTINPDLVNLDFLVAPFVQQSGNTSFYNAFSNPYFNLGGATPDPNYVAESLPYVGSMVPGLGGITGGQPIVYSGGGSVVTGGGGGGGGGAYDPTQVTSTDKLAVLRVSPGFNTAFVNPGVRVTYYWDSVGVDDPSRYQVESWYTSDKPDTCGNSGTGPFPWIANTLQGSSSGTIQQCQLGVSYTINFKVTDTQTGKSETSVVVVAVRDQTPPAFRDSMDVTPTQATINKGNSQTFLAKYTPGFFLDPSKPGLVVPNFEQPPTGITIAAFPYFYQEFAAKENGFTYTVSVGDSVASGTYQIRLKFDILGKDPVYKTITIIVP